jgi:hypothetical protein
LITPPPILEEEEEEETRDDTTLFVDVREECIDGTRAALDSPRLALEIENMHNSAFSNLVCIPDSNNGGRRCTIDYDTLPGNPNGKVEQECLRVGDFIQVSYGAECTTANAMTGRYFATNIGACVSRLCSEEERVPLYKYVLSQELNDRVDGGGKVCVIHLLWVRAGEMRSFTVREDNTRGNKIRQSDSGLLEAFDGTSPQVPSIHTREKEIQQAVPNFMETFGESFPRYGIDELKEAGTNSTSGAGILQVTPPRNIFTHRGGYNASHDSLG